MPCKPSLTVTEESVLETCKCLSSKAHCCAMHSQGLYSQGSYIAAIHPQRTRVSSIFQKVNNQDDIDAEMLKHVQFAAQRNSFVGTASAADAKSSPSQTASPTQPGKPAAQQNLQPSQAASAQGKSAMQLVTSDNSTPEKGTPAESNAKTSVTDAASVPVEDFTLAKIEQSIADIEAELGWVSEPAVQPVLPSVPEGRPESAAAPPSTTGQHCRLAAHPCCRSGKSHA